MGREEGGKKRRMEAPLCTEKTRGPAAGREASLGKPGLGLWEASVLTASGCLFSSLPQLEALIKVHPPLQTICK